MRASWDPRAGEYHSELKSTRAQIEKPYKSNWVGVSGKFIGRPRRRRRRVCVGMLYNL